MIWHDINLFDLEIYQSKLTYLAHRKWGLFSWGRIGVPFTTSAVKLKMPIHYVELLPASVYLLEKPLDDPNRATNRINFPSMAFSQHRLGSCLPPTRLHRVQELLHVGLAVQEVGTNVIVKSRYWKVRRQPTIGITSSPLEPTWSTILAHSQQLDWNIKIIW